MTYKRKLIEVALPLEAVNKASAAGKYAGSRPHPQTIHRWWARRPLPAARAVLWSSLVDDPSAHPQRFPSEEDQDRERQRLFGILERLVTWEESNSKELLEAAKAEILASCGGELPNVLDPFCGGGTIPLEAQRLGLPVYGGDLNPIAVLISKAMVEIPPRFAGLAPVNPESRGNAGLRTWEGSQGLAEDVRYYGEWMRDRAFEKIGHLYPKVDLPEDQGGGEATVIAWIWARTVESPDPSWAGHVPLVRSWVLRKAKKNRPAVWVEPIIDPESQTITYRIREGGTPPDGTVTRGKGRCVATGSPITGDYIKKAGRSGNLGATLIALVTDARGQRVYTAPISRDSSVTVEWTPRGQVPERLTGGTCYGYGLTEWGDLFTDHQLVSLNAFDEALSEVERAVTQDIGDSAFADSDETPLAQGGRGTLAYAQALVTYLGLAISKSAEYWCSLCSWNSSNQQIRNLFARQGFAMTWDFTEVNPFSGLMGSWDSMLGWVARGVESLTGEVEGFIAQRNAVERLSDVDRPVVSTDPPYYDNIAYSDLSDFFYPWLRRSLGAVWPEEFATMVTPKEDELVANRHRSGSSSRAREHFETGMARFLGVLDSVHHPEFPAAVFYAFKQEETDQSGTASTGWETFLQALIEAHFVVTATWPLRTEMAARTVATGTSALASSIVIACRPRPVDAPRVSASEFVAALRGELPDAIRLLQKESIAPVDMAQSAIGPGMAVFSRYAEVIEASDEPMSVRRALILINEVLQEVLSEEETEFDSDTRWALTWFEQNGLNPAVFGEADVLARAKNTSVKGVVDAGIAAQRDGKVRLKSRDELLAGWDPSDDPRPTVWEATQHLVAALAESESEAADLMRRLGSERAERARQLSYLLYQVADRKGWAEEAVAYNGLVQAWTEISRLAGQTQIPVQQTLGE